MQDKNNFISKSIQLTRISNFRFRIALSTLALSSMSAFSTPASADEPLLPVKLWVAGKTLVLKISPLADSKETYVPLEALPSFGASGKLINNGEKAQVSFFNYKEETFPIVRQNGKPMLSLTLLAEKMNANVVRQTPETKQPDKANLRSDDTIYLLARVTGASLENGILKVTTSFPVPFHTRMLAEEMPARGYVDCVGAEMADDFQPKPLTNRDERIIRLRAGQNSPTIARVVVELSDGYALKTGDSRNDVCMVPTLLKSSFSRQAKPSPGSKEKSSEFSQRSLQAKTKTENPTSERNDERSKVVKNQTRENSPPGKIVDERNPLPGENVSNNDPPKSETGSTGASIGKRSQNPLASNNARSARREVKLPSRGAKLKRDVPIPPPPTEATGLEIDTRDASTLRFTLAVNGKTHASVHYSPGSTQMLIDLPNTVLHFAPEERTERTLQHPLLNGVRMETVQGTTPTTRLTLETPRILGYSIIPGTDTLTLELRLPRNATGALADKLIVIDPGHGGHDNGCRGGDFSEKDISLAIALKLRTELESAGARVVMTRSTDVFIPLETRAKMANEIGADLFLSIHNNWVPNTSVSGTMSFYHNSEPSCRALALCIYNAVTGVSGLQGRGANSDRTLYANGLSVLRNCTVPSVLCEVAFLSNPADRNRLVNEEFQQKIAQALTDGLRSYVEGSPSSRSAPTAVFKPESDGGGG